MKAIPTTYDNTSFRSRLEADWAATLNSRDIPWHYELEGFELSDGSWYLPDFYLPTAKAWLEVKGPHQQRVDKLEQFAADLWDESTADTTYDDAAPMVLLGQAPLKPTRHFMPLPPLLGVMGPRKAYSVIMSRCPVCCVGTVVALWQPRCRNCGHDFGSQAAEVWMSAIDLHQDFCYAPRSQ